MLNQLRSLPLEALLPILLAVGLSLLFLAGIGTALIARYKGRLFMGVLAVILLGYMTTGKGAAYIGIRPIYISELTLALGMASVVIVALVQRRINIGALRHIDAPLLILFILWGAYRTLPNLWLYGIEALRDGVIWGYAIFAFCIALLVPRATLDRVISLYGRLIPFLLVWMILIYLLPRLIGPLPTVPGSSVRIIALKAGDAGVHLGGIAAYLLLRLDLTYPPRFTKWQLWGMWLLWGAGWIIHGASSRGGMLSALVAIFLVFWLRPQRIGWLRPATLVTLLLVGLLTLESLGISLDDGGRRNISIEQVVTNIVSTFGIGDEVGNESDTRRWRLNWWSAIIDYTFNGPYLWGGKGYGINLAQDDGFRGRVNEDGDTNRHPHNIVMNVLARSGVIGLALYLSFLISFGRRLMLYALPRTPRGDFALWLLSYWMAFFFNAQFDVFLEGPMGGIWFWSLVGIAWVYLRYPLRFRLFDPAPHPSIAQASTPNRRPLDGYRLSIH
jgi:hypothetical protein